MKIKQYSKYSDVPLKYRFDIDSILKGESVDDLINKVKLLLDEIYKFKEMKYESAETFLHDHKLNLELNLLTNRLNNYLANKNSVNVIDSEINELQESLQFMLYEFSVKYGSDITRFYANASKLKEWVKLEQFKDIKRDILYRLSLEKHTLPEEVEEALVKYSYGHVQTYPIFNILTSSELDYGFAVDSNGKKIKVTPANRTNLAQHKDKNVRKSSIISYNTAFFKHRESMSSMLIQHIKSLTVDSKVRNFPSAIESIIMDDFVDLEFIQTLYSCVSSNVHIFKKFNDNRKKFYFKKFGEKPTKYDHAREIIDVKNNFTIEEAQEIVLKAFEPFGEEYVKIVKTAYDERWIDYMPVDNKISGAYSIDNSYGLDKLFILMNFDGKFESLETLAHELGHSLHSHYSNTNQSQDNAEYPIFLAEIASIFNELMLYDYMLKTSNDKKFKFKILESMITGFIATVLRQTEWSNYEFDLYTALEKGEPINSYEALSKIYYENKKKYAVKMPTKMEPIDFVPAIYVPHYYYEFYVYKYAIGQLVANIFFAKYKSEGKDYLQTYIKEFLSAGDSDEPLETLKKCGIDLKDKNSYDQGFSYVKNIIDEYVKLGKEIFKL